MITFGSASFILIWCYCLFCVFNPYVTAVILSVTAIVGAVLLAYYFPVVGLVVITLMLLYIPSLIAKLFRRIFPVTEKQREAARLAKNAQQRKNRRLKKEAAIAAAHKALDNEHGLFTPR